jgi:hypothetical protein
MCLSIFSSSLLLLFVSSFVYARARACVCGLYLGLDIYPLLDIYPVFEAESAPEGRDARKKKEKKRNPQHSSCSEAN